MMIEIKEIKDDRITGTDRDLIKEPGSAGKLKLPKPYVKSWTIASTEVEPGGDQTLFIWEEGNMPVAGAYFDSEKDIARKPSEFDPEDFRPYVTILPTNPGAPVKGGLVIASGGGFHVRADGIEAMAAAEVLRSMGYYCFIVDYRVLPNHMMDGALDIARVVRFAKLHAREYGFEENRVALLGFSAGGFLSALSVMECLGDNTPDRADPAYVPDDLDKVNGSVAGFGMIYSYFGDPDGNRVLTAEELEKFDIPEIYSCYGSKDMYAGQIDECLRALADNDVKVSRAVLPDTLHGFGALGGWMYSYNDWLDEVLGK